MVFEQFEANQILTHMKKQENSVQDLDRQAAIDKFRELVNHNSICLLTTNLTEIPLATRPMSVQKVCDQGNFWFLSSIDSKKNAEINLDPRVQLFFSNTSNSEFLTVYGKASIIKDKMKIEELWSPLAKAWFTEGKDDPRISVIKVSPEDSFYWDTKYGKMVSSVKIAISALTGETMDVGVKGALTLN